MNSTNRHDFGGLKRVTKRGGVEGGTSNLNDEKGNARNGHVQLKKWANSAKRCESLNISKTRKKGTV